MPPATSTATVNNTADLAIAKIAPPNIGVGQNLAYAITLSNNGVSPANTVAWNDTLQRTGRVSPVGTINDISGSPVIDRGRVFAIGHAGRMVSIDLRTGELRDHDPADLITRLVPVSYDAEATCPIWERFVAESMCGDASMVAFLQRVAGYSITGDVSAEAWFLHVGDGANGKSTFFEILSALLGDMACAVPVGVLTGSPSESEDPKSMSARAKLAGRRLAVANESSTMATLDDATSKMLASNAHIPAKFMGRDIFEYMPSHKLHLTTNHPPRVRGSEYGVWRRIYPVRWDNVVTSPDLKLQHKLRAELAGILAWCVRGALAYQQQGLAEPKGVTRARDSMREASDTIGIFLADNYDLYPARREAPPKDMRRMGISVTVADLRAAYTAWCAKEGEKFPLGPTALRVALASHGCIQDRDRADNRAYLGLVPRGMLRSIIPQQPQQHLPAVN